MAATPSLSSIQKNMEKSLLRSNINDTFRFLEIAFSVAATRWPQDLRSRRPHIMDMLYAASQEEAHHDHDHQKQVLITINPHPDQKKKKKIVAVLRDNQATRKTHDHDHHKAAAAAEKHSVVAPVMMSSKKQQQKNKENNIHHHHLNHLKKKIQMIAPSHDQEETRLEASITKLNGHYRADQVNKRKIQVVEFLQAQNKKMKKKINNNNSIPSSITKIPWKKFKEYLMRWEVINNNIHPN